MSEAFSPLQSNKLPSDIPAPETLRNPEEFLKAFRNSEIYHKLMDEFFLNKTLAPDVTLEDKQQVLEGDDRCRIALIKFVFDRVIDEEVDLNFPNFSYDPKYYTESFNNKLKEYFSIIDLRKDMPSSVGSERLAAYDTDKRVAHNAAASELVKTLGVPHKLARGIVQVFAVQEQHETLENILHSESAVSGPPTGSRR